MLISLLKWYVYCYVYFLIFGFIIFQSFPRYSVISRYHSLRTEGAMWFILKFYTTVDFWIHSSSPKLFPNLVLATTVPVKNGLEPLRSKWTLFQWHSIWTIDEWLKIDQIYKFDFIFHYSWYIGWTSCNRALSLIWCSLIDIAAKIERQLSRLIKRFFVMTL